MEYHMHLHSLIPNSEGIFMTKEEIWLQTYNAQKKCMNFVIQISLNIFRHMCSKIGIAKNFGYYGQDHHYWIELIFFILQY